MKPKDLKKYEQNKEKFTKEIVEVIKKYNFMRFNHIAWNLLSFSRSTAYLYDLDEVDEVKEALRENRAKAVNYLLNKWVQSDNPTLNIAAMRIIADDQDRIRLNQHYIEQHTEITPILPEDLTILNNNKNNNIIHE